jgi:hypothetical protein
VPREARTKANVTSERRVSGFLRVKDWDRLQHYKHRNPPWIKFYTALLDNPDFLCLPEVTQAHLAKIFLLAARTQNRIPANRRFVEGRIGACEAVDFQRLVREGWLEADGDASDVLAGVLAATLALDADNCAPPEQSRDRVEAEKSSGANAPGEAPRTEKPLAVSRPEADWPTDGQLMSLVRKHLYIPDGKPPAGHDDGRCVSVIQALRRLGSSGYDIADAIEGLAVLRDSGQLDWLPKGTKATMRALYNTRSGVRPVFYLAQEALHKHAASRRPRPEDNGGTPERIGAIMRAGLRP